MSLRNSRDKGIANAAMWVLLVTVISKVIGFTESAIAASYFGTTSEIDMFYLASTIANRFVFTIFSGLSVVGLTMYNSAREEAGIVQANRFVSALITCVVPLAMIVTAIIFFAAPWVADIMASNYGEGERYILVKYLRELCGISVFYALTTIFTCILNAHKRFLPGVMVGIIQNLSMILFMVVLSDELGVNSIVLGLGLAYVLQSLFLYYIVKSVFKFTTFSIRKDIDVKRLLLLIAPLVLGEATGEINTLVDQYLATMQGEGYVSGLTYSETLNDVVTALFIQTLTTVLLSYFSSMAVQKKYDEMLNEFKAIVKIMTLLLIPVSIVTIFSAKEVVGFLFERGNFNTDSVRITSLALIGYGAGFLFKTLMVIAKRPFFAIDNTRIPMIIGIVTVVINIVLSTSLSMVMGIMGITLGTSISYLLSCMFYYYALSKSFPTLSWKDCGGFLFKVIISAALCIFLVFVGSKLIKANCFVTLCAITAICFTTFFLTLKILKLPELEIITSKIKTLKRK